MIFCGQQTPKTQQYFQPSRQPPDKILPVLMLLPDATWQGSTPQLLQN